MRTWKRSTDPDFKAKRDPIVELYEMAEAGEAIVICLDECGPLNLQPQPGGKGWAPRAKPKRTPVTYKRPHGVRHLIAAYDVGRDRLYGHVKKRKDRVHFLEFCRYIRSLYPAETRLHFILDNFNPHHGEQMRAWAAANNVDVEPRRPAPAVRSPLCSCRGSASRDGCRLGVRRTYLLGSTRRSRSRHCSESH